MCPYMYIYVCVCVSALLVLSVQRTLTNANRLENPPSVQMGKLV